MAASLLWPRVARAQQTARPIIGFLNSRVAGGFQATSSPRSTAGWRKTALSRARTSRTNSVGRSVNMIDCLSLPPSLFVAPVTVIIASGGGKVLESAAKAARRRIPIVFAVGSDPVKYGLVSSLNQAPTANLTGVNIFTTALEARSGSRFVRQLMPAAKTIGFLINPQSSVSEGLQPGSSSQCRTAACHIGRQVLQLEERSVRSSARLTRANFES